MVEYKEKQDLEEDHKRYLLQVAGEVEQMLVSERRIRERFVQQVRLCEQKYDDYYRWLDTQHKAAKKNPRLLDDEAGSPPKKGYILDNGWWRKPDREDLPDITAWFYPFTTTIKTSRGPNVEEQFMRSCVLLAIVHDSVLQNSQQEPIYFTPKGTNPTSFQSWATQNIWKWLNGVLWRNSYASENIEKAAKEIPIMLDAALTSVRNDLSNLGPTETDSGQGKFGFHPKEPSES